jgi:hypothetical protein
MVVKIMMYEQKCSRCGKLMKRIPIKRLDSKIIIEYYCYYCDESLTYYPEHDEFKFKKANYF